MPSTHPLPPSLHHHFFTPVSPTMTGSISASDAIPSSAEKRQHQGDLIRTRWIKDSEVDHDRIISTLSAGYAVDIMACDCSTTTLNPSISRRR